MAYFAPSLYAAANPETTAISCMSAIGESQDSAFCLGDRHTENSPCSSEVGITLGKFQHERGAPGPICRCTFPFITIIQGTVPP